MSGAGAGANVAVPPAVQSYTPVTPKMGGLQQTGGTEHVPWTGGKPKKDWSALKATPAIMRPAMLRPNSAGSAQKSQACRTQGLEKTRLWDPNQGNQDPRV